MGKQKMTAKVLEKMLLVTMWWKKDEFCKQYGATCVGCPFDKGRVCDKATTEFVLASAGETFDEYFNEIKRSKPPP